MEEFKISCPFCGELIDILIDPSAEEQEYYEDCSVCCNPILFNIVVDQKKHIEIRAQRDNE